MPCLLLFPQSTPDTSNPSSGMTVNSSQALLPVVVLDLLVFSYCEIHSWAVFFLTTYQENLLQPNFAFSVFPLGDKFSGI